MKRNLEPVSKIARRPFSRRVLIILDGHNLLFKAYGIPFKFNSSKGTPLHVATAFLSMIRRAVRVADVRGGCTEIAVVFDSEHPTSNHALSADYKATRKKDYSQDEDSPFHHMPQVASVLKHLKIKTYMKRGVEADDIVASLARQYRDTHQGAHVFIASTDSDFYQLISGSVSQVLYGKKGADGFLGPKDIKQKLGVLPSQYVRFKSMTGDKADNIAGVPGIGKVGAAKIVNRARKFDAKPHADLLAKNKRLIELNQGLSVCKNWKPLAFRKDRLFAKNTDIFHGVGL